MLNMFCFAVRCLIGLSFFTTLLGISACGVNDYRKHPAVISSRMNEKELQEIPSEIEASSLRLDGATLRTHWLLDMLSEKNIAYIDIKPAPSMRDPQRSSLAVDGSDQSISHWLYPVSTYMFVRLKLSTDGDQTCVSDKDLPYDMSYRIRKAPLLPDTCLSLTVIPKSDAQLHLRYNANHERGEPYAKWELVEQATGKIVASLTTIDNEGRPSISRDFRVKNNQPYVALAALINNRNGPRLFPYLAYQKFDLSVKNHPFGRHSIPEYTNVDGQVRVVEYTAEQVNSFIRKDWSSAVAEAKNLGWGNYGELLMEHKSGLIYRLIFDGNPAVRISAADMGFIVYPWIEKNDSRFWAVRYDVQGQVVWGITVVLPLNWSRQQDCIPASVHSARMSNENLIFESLCSDPKNSGAEKPGIRRVQQVFINKKDIENALYQLQH